MSKTDFVHRFLSLAGLLAILLPLHASAGIVDTEFVVQAAQRGAIIWDVRSEEAYVKGHIPGAINIDDAQVALRDGKSEDYLPVAQMEKILGDAGIDPHQEIVVYGAKALPGAYFAQQALRYLGAERVSVYHGGFDDWKAAGRPVSSERSTLPPVMVNARLNQHRVISTEDVLARLQQPDTQIVDVRTHAEFTGDDIRALRGGHIPGAVNIPYEQNWVDPDTPLKLFRRQVQNKDGMALKSRTALQALYASLDPEKETIVYCQSGSRASQTAAVLEELGFKDVKIYDGSWLVYGNNFGAPAEDESYFNVGRVNSQLNQMQGRIDMLEAELEALKAAAARQQ